MKHARADYDHIQDPTGHIPADEPVFLLRAGDMNAPNAVRHWAHQAWANGASREGRAGTPMTGKRPKPSRTTCWKPCSTPLCRHGR